MSSFGSLSKLGRSSIAFYFIASSVTSCGNSESSSNGSRKSVANKTNDDVVVDSSDIPSPSPTPSNSPTNPTNPSIPTTPSDCYKTSAFICKIETLIAAKTNSYRLGQGIQALAVDQKIAFVARDWSKKQGDRGSIGHDGFPNARAQVYKQEFTIAIDLYGENVAMSGRVNSSAEDDNTAEKIASEFAVMWWNSSGHRANMLRSSFQSIGVGVYKTSPNGSWYATQIFK